MLMNCCTKAGAELCVCGDAGGNNGGARRGARIEAARRAADAERRKGALQLAALACAVHATSLLGRSATRKVLWEQGSWPDRGGQDRRGAAIVDGRIQAAGTAAPRRRRKASPFACTSRKLAKENHSTRRQRS